MQGDSKNLHAFRRRRQHPDFLTAGEVIAAMAYDDELLADVLGSWERDHALLTPELDAAIIRARLNAWALGRLPLFAGRAA
jgi:hypothetical protein